ncbi:MAG: iron-only hydrogenase system regulator [Lachnospiraceae bacterium]|nr:iron-only hydrogenase system regulator [Lachnospiraceae bacterium]MBQ9606920.1 iron-only hydrogenase system regulator [Lachnospiraceae bacterium]MBR1524739.1 iron-only hydrogenase system regulator [Lachnospiraceae bacterium]
MDNRIVLLGIIVKEQSQVPELNRLLSDNQQYIIGRMGMPHHRHGDSELAIISIAMEAPQDVISTLSGRIGMLKGISSKVVYADCD